MADQIGTLLWEMRTAGGWTLGRLAQQAGVSKMALSRWEAGTRQPRIPELEAVLKVLNASSSQCAAIISSIKAPRGIQHLRKITACAGLEQLPMGGELLRSMRLRKGVTQAYLAKEMQVTQATIARWESGERLPDTAQIQSWCYLLDAREEELIALTTSYLSEPWEYEPKNWHSEQEEIQATLSAALYKGTHILSDLFYLTLERKVLLWAMHEEAARPLLGLLYGWHAQALRNEGRLSEVGTIAQKALQYALPQDPESWSRAVVLSATGAVYGGSRTAPERGIRQLKRGLEGDISPAFRAWMLSDIASYSDLMGQTEQRLMLLAQACRVAEQSTHTMELFLRRCDFGAALLEVGRPCEAMRMLPELTEGYAQENVQALLLWSEAHRQAGNLSEAHAALSYARNLTLSNKLEWLLPRVEAIEKRF